MTASNQAATHPFVDLTQPNRASMRALLGLHGLESVAQVIGIWLAKSWLHLTLPYAQVWWVVGLYALWNAASWWWYRRNNTGIRSVSVFVQLGANMLALTALLYFSGGFTNPFVSLYLVPVALASTILRPAWAVPLGLLSVAGYSALTRWYHPLHSMHHGGAHDGHAMTMNEMGSSLHFFGMWVNYVISAVVVMVFLSFLAQLSRKRARALAHAKEQALRNEQVVALGSLAAGAAHALSTPLSTVAMLLDELDQPLEGAERTHITHAAREQIQACRTHLSDLLRSAGNSRLHHAKRMPISVFLNKTIHDWQLMHPDMQLRNHWDESLNRAASLDVTFRHSLTNLLDNAADANRQHGTHHIDMDAHIESSMLHIQIQDQGGGDADALNRLPASDKSEGHGTGLLLTRANLERIGGSLNFSNHRDGCHAYLHIPLHDHDIQGSET